MRQGFRNGLFIVLCQPVTQALHGGGGLLLLSVKQGIAAAVACQQHGVGLVQLPAADAQMLRGARFGQKIRFVAGMAVLRCREHYGSVLPDTEDVAIADMPAKPASVRMGGIKQQRAVAFLRRHAQHLQRRLTRCRRRGGGFLRRQCVERIKRDLQVIGNPLHQTLRSPLTVGTAASAVAEHDPRQGAAHKAGCAVLAGCPCQGMVTPTGVGG